MKIKPSSKKKGFSLIEVMIALVILAVGVLGISKLQGTLIKNSSNANQRTVAVSIAQKKIDDLKSFVLLTSSDTWTVASGASATNLNAASLAYSHIEDNKGGAPVSTVDLITEKTIVAGNYNYSLSWTVSDYWHTGVFPTTATSTAPSPLPPYSDMKLVTITVAWTDELGDPQDVSLSTVIDAYAPALTAFSDNPTSIGNEGPIVKYTPLAAPDVVPVTLDIGGQKKESSKPVPDLSKKGDSTVVKFQTVTYTPNGSEFDTDRVEEFITTVCNCKTGPTPDTTEVKFGEQEWDVEDSILRDIVVTKAVSTITKTDVDNGGGETQAAECTVCCRDGADNAGSFKTCRLKRVDGIPRIVEPWKMIAFNIIPSSYFNTGTGASGATSSNSIPNMTSTVQASNIELYSDYAIEQVRAALATWDADPTITIVPDTNFKTYVNGASEPVAGFVNTIGASTVDHTQFNTGSTNSRELQARALYLDVPPAGIYESGLYTPTGASAVPLDRVPFFENNFTQIAGWIPDIDVGKNGSNIGDQTFGPDYTDNHDDMDNSSCQQTDTPSSSRNYVTNEEFFYFGGGTTTDCLNASRGKFYPIVVAASAIPITSASTVKSQMFISNDGVIDRKIDTGASTAEASIELTIQ